MTTPTAGVPVRPSHRPPTITQVQDRTDLRIDLQVKLLAMLELVPDLDGLPIDSETNAQLHEICGTLGGCLKQMRGML